MTLFVTMFGFDVLGVQTLIDVVRIVLACAADVFVCVAAPALAVVLGLLALDVI